MSAEGKHPLLPKATEASCPHEHLRFEDGTLHMVCIDCGDVWTKTGGKNGPVDMKAMAVAMFPPRNTRHDRWVLPRTEPLKKP